jgi:hypothetical protein
MNALSATNAEDKLALRYGNLLSLSLHTQALLRICSPVTYTHCTLLGNAMQARPNLFLLSRARLQEHGVVLSRVRGVFMTVHLGALCFPFDAAPSRIELRT